MKSILVDALRQANSDDTDQALSDSGSFDASHEAFESPANDTLEREDGELELMSTTSALVVREKDAEDHELTAKSAEEEPEVALEMEVDNMPVEDDHAVTIVGMKSLPVPKRRTPRLARFAPYVCAVVGVTVAGSWLLVNKLNTARASLGTVASESQNGELVDVKNSDTTPENRFPFIENGQAKESRGTGQ